MEQRFWQILSATNEWVRYSDGKAVALLGIQGVLIGLSVTLLKDWFTANDTTLASKILICAGAISIGMSALFTFFCLLPRLKNDNKIKKSPIYFGSIAVHFQNSDAYAKYIKENFESDEDISDALTDQIYINARIANAKFMWLTWSIRLIMIGLAFWTVFFIFTL